MTTADLISRVRDLIAEASADYFDDAEILVGLNEGKHMMFADLDVMPSTFDISLTADTEAVDITQNVSRWLWLMFGTEYLLPVTSEEFARLKASDQSGDPSYYCPEFLKSDGTLQLHFYPTPSTTEADAITAYAYLEPADLTTAATPVNPTWHEPYHALPCYWAAAILLRKDRLRDQAEFEERRFYAGIEQYRRWFERKFPRRVDATREVPPLRPGFEMTGTWPHEVTP